MVETFVASGDVRINVKEAHIMIFMIDWEQG